MTIAVDFGRKATKQTKKKDTMVAFLKFLLLFYVNFENVGRQKQKYDKLPTMQ